VSFGSTFSSLKPPGGPTGIGASGFQNFDTTFKYRVFKNPEHEFVMSAGLSIEWGGTGAESVGAEQFNTYTPTIWFGKGLGDLPDTLSWIRPVAITGQVGYAIPGRNSTTTFGIDADTGDLTGRGNPFLRGAITGIGTFLGGVFHTLPFLISDVQTALIVAGGVVAVEFFAIAWIRKRFLHIPYRSSLLFVATGGLISLAIGVGLGAS